MLRCPYGRFIARYSHQSVLPRTNPEVAITRLVDSIKKGRFEGYGRGSQVMPSCVLNRPRPVDIHNKKAHRDAARGCEDGASPNIRRLQPSNTLRKRLHKNDIPDLRSHPKQPPRRPRRHLRHDIPRSPLHYRQPLCHQPGVRRLVPLPPMGLRREKRGVGLQHQML